jgi:hypothetical protein
MSDSLIGDLVSELVSEAIAEAMEGDEMGRLRGRRRDRKLGAQARRALGGGEQSPAAALRQLAAHNPAAAAQVSQQAMNQAAQMLAGQTGIPQSVGPFIAPSSQRIETLHLGSATLAAAAASAISLSQNVQRAIQAQRLIVQCADSTTGADQLFSVGITNVALGAHNLLATPGIAGAATAYGANAWNTDILSVPLGQGGQVQINFTRLAATANPGVVSGVIFGTSAHG